MNNKPRECRHLCIIAKFTFIFIHAFGSTDTSTKPSGGFLEPHPTALESRSWLGATLQLARDNYLPDFRFVLPLLFDIFRFSSHCSSADNPSLLSCHLEKLPIHALGCTSTRPSTYFRESHPTVLESRSWLGATLWLSQGLLLLDCNLLMPFFLNRTDNHFHLSGYWVELPIHAFDSACISTRPSYFFLALPRTVSNPRSWLDATPWSTRDI